MSERTDTPWPSGPWAWREFGPLVLVTRHEGGKVVLAVNRDARIVARSGPRGVLEPITPEHPVARLLEAAPLMYEALKLFEGHYPRGINPDLGERTEGQPLRRSWKTDLITARPTQAYLRRSRVLSVRVRGLTLLSRPSGSVLGWDSVGDRSGNGQEEVRR